MDEREIADLERSERTAMLEERAAKERANIQAQENNSRNVDDEEPNREV